MSPSTKNNINLNVVNNIDKDVVKDEAEGKDEAADVGKDVDVGRYMYNRKLHSQSTSQHISQPINHINQSSTTHNTHNSTHNTHITNNKTTTRNNINANHVINNDVNINIDKTHSHLNTGATIANSCRMASHCSSEKMSNTN
eukprot:PhM_4_TR14164/c1_g1_i2/m.99731